MFYESQDKRAFKIVFKNLHFNNSLMENLICLTEININLDNILNYA